MSSTATINLVNFACDHDDHLQAALTAAFDLAQHAAKALAAQQEGRGTTRAIYSQQLKDIRALTWCAITDLGRAKRLAVHASSAATGAQNHKP